MFLNVLVDVPSAAILFIVNVGFSRGELVFGCKYKALMPISHALHGQGTVTSGLQEGFMIPMAPACTILILKVTNKKVAIFFMNLLIRPY